jgi:lysophospholipase L1-like esterase
VAKSGWTTGELKDGIAGTKLLPAYNFVSLLIGVNNEYRGREQKEYEEEFEQLLKQAVHFAGDNPAHVFVLSIPDWSLTPFAQASLPDAKGRDQKKVAEEIKTFNAANQRITQQYKANYIDITTDTRKNAADPSFLASDLLHPSGKQYERWAKQLAEQILKQIQQ